MTTRERLLELFENNRDIYFSGEELAQNLSVSRTAVWKAVKSLQEDGYSIDAVKNKGYALSSMSDVLSAQAIRKYLPADDKNLLRTGKLDINVIPVTESTNILVREGAKAGKEDGYMVIAGEQTAGSGRLGRRFHSPAGTGIYMSILLKPENRSMEQATSVTTMAAVAVCEAIEAVSDEKAEIKWVNDIFVRGKKVCGILTEGSFNMENGMLDYAVLGIGINVYEPEGGFPEEIRDIAGAVFTKREKDVKNRLVAEFLKSFSKYYNGEQENSYAQEYRKRSFVIGKDVKLITPKETRKAKVLDIDDHCRLRVRYDDGSEETVFSGEISLRF